jgi:hypothetical protein
MVYENKIAENIHRITLDIDYELSICKDQRIRQRLVRAVYELRDLEHFLNFQVGECSACSKVQQVLHSN